MYLVSHLGNTPAKEEGKFKDVQFYCRCRQWWDKYSVEELITMQRRGQQLRSGGWAAVEWDDLNGRRYQPAGFRLRQRGVM